MQVEDPVSSGVVRGLLLFLCGFALLRETFLLLFE